MALTYAASSKPRKGSYLPVCGCCFHKFEVLPGNFSVNVDGPASSNSRSPGPCPLRHVLLSISKSSMSGVSSNCHSRLLERTIVYYYGNDQRAEPSCLPQIQAGCQWNRRDPVGQRLQLSKTFKTFNPFLSLCLVTSVEKPIIALLLTTLKYSI